MNRLVIPIALLLTMSAAPAAAKESLPARTLDALAVAIASQGDAALVWIRKELTGNLRETLQPRLPRPDHRPAPEPADEQPAIPSPAR